MREVTRCQYGSSAKLKEQKNGFTSLLGTKLNDEVNLVLVSCVCCDD